MTSRSSHLSLVLAALALVAGTAVTVAGAPPAAAYPTANVRFEGHGWGHGRGLGQYGSLGYALDDRQPYSWILDHYYSNTTKGTQADAPLTVHLRAWDNKDMILTSEAPFQIDGNQIAAGTLAKVVHTSTGYDLFTADKGSDASHRCTQATWTKVTTLAGSATPTATSSESSEDVTRMLRTCRPSGSDQADEIRSYRGTIKMLTATSGTTYVINTVNMENYLRGVVPRESPAYWGDLGGGAGMNALKAQAVAARSYAWAENRNPPYYKTCDDIACQVYGGAGLNGTRIEDARSDTAISQTAGEVRILNGAVARTEFSSSTGGWTAGGTFPAVEDAGDDVGVQADGKCPSPVPAGSVCNPFHNWTSDVPVTTVETAFPEAGTLQAISVTKRNGLGADGGRVLSAKIVGSTTTLTVTGNDVRSKLGLRSDWYSVIDVPVDVLRIAGTDRIGTSIAISKSAFTDGAAHAAVLASSANYPDALVGAPLAVQASGPILLTDPATLTEATKGELTRVVPKGSEVYLLGGTGALAQAVEDQVRALGYDVVRYGGANRFETAVKVADALHNPSTVLEATGLLFPDALAAGAAAAKVNGAILLTNGSTQAPETAAYLVAHPPTVKYAIGGSAATADPSATKVAGADRYATAVAVATKFFDSAAAGGLASGEAYFDALGGGVHVGLQDGPLLLTQAKVLPTSTAAYFRDAAGVVKSVFAYGGTAAIADAVLTDLRTS
jgi:SpoIID/LytB domain protein